jgi:hypothetical protein
MARGELRRLTSGGSDRPARPHRPLRGSGPPSPLRRVRHDRRARCRLIGQPSVGPNRRHRSDVIRRWSDAGRSSFACKEAPPAATALVSSARNRRLVGSQLTATVRRCVENLRVGGQFATHALRRFQHADFEADQQSVCSGHAEHVDLQVLHAGGGTRTHGLRIMMTARRGHLRLARGRTGVLRSPQFASKSGVGRTVGRTVWAPAACQVFWVGREVSSPAALTARRSFEGHASGGRSFKSAFGWGSKGRWFKSSRPDYLSSALRQRASPASPSSPGNSG